ncbi:hypothetical protein [Brevibacillus reuszeri]|uniref:hypothetical protein n=1 Tax=Brevibacillus reuszeri TaxID=54915 RepID=UPI000CCC8532|nr:hypothetical protein [Brevibacillus reuszeri]
MKDTDIDFEEEMFNIHRPRRIVTDPVEKELMDKSNAAFMKIMEQPTIENKMVYDKIEEELKAYRKQVMDNLKQEIEDERKSK